MTAPAGRVAVLSDIHGVMPALAAVLAEPDLAAADLIVLTGDLAAGPQPAETLGRLAALGDRAVWIRGNADRELVEFARGEAAEVTAVVCGHTHMPFIRLAHGRLVVNPGSVGMPYGRPGAHWALLGPGAELRRTAFDPDAACARIAAESGFPQAREWADYFVRARATDAEALAAFAPRDGRG